jgi:hypothetical protein
MLASSAKKNLIKSGFKTSEQVQGLKLTKVN